MPVDLQVGFEGVHLTAEGVAPHHDVDGTAAVAGRAGRPGSRSPARSSRRRSRRPAARPAALRTSGSRSSKTSSSRQIVVDSPPGMTMPSSSANSVARRIGRAVTPSPASATRCSRTSPCSARTPTTGSARLIGAASSSPRASAAGLPGHQHDDDDEQQRRSPRIRWRSAGSPGALRSSARRVQQVFGGAPQRGDDRDQGEAHRQGVQDDRDQHPRRADRCVSCGGHPDDAEPEQRRPPTRAG